MALVVDAWQTASAIVVQHHREVAALRGLLRSSCAFRLPSRTYMPPTPFAIAGLAGQGSSISNVIAWGDGVVDVSHATVDGKWALSLTDNALPATTPASPEAAADAIISHMKVHCLVLPPQPLSLPAPNR